MSGVIMKIPKKIRTYCPFCRKHTVHSLKEAKRGQRRTLSWGQQKHLKKIKGYTSKIGKTLKHVKQSKKTVMMLTCSECKKAHRKVLPHSKKKPEFKK